MDAGAFTPASTVGRYQQPALDLKTLQGGYGTARTPKPYALVMKFPRRLILRAFAFGMALAASVHAKQPAALEIFWIDSEGGGSTLIVTPAGESILIDAGNPGPRDARRIHKVATEVAGIQKIDHMVVTHFHVDHFGGVADLVNLMPIGVLYDKGIPSAPPDLNGDPRLWAVLSAPYREATVGNRAVLKAGTSIPLRRSGGSSPAPSLRCIAANRERENQAAPNDKQNPACSAAHEPGELDTTDNANSLVLILEFGDFRFFNGADLTWQMEEKLVCPHNLVGHVDLFQVNHHGLNVSNNPLLVTSLAPTVAVMNNGPRKGASQTAFESLRQSPAIQAVYQVHENIQDNGQNTSADLIANHGARGEQCEAHFIRCSVTPDGGEYTMTIPSTNHRRSFKTRPRQ